MYSILKYGRLKLSDIEHLEQAKTEALKLVTPITGSEYIEIQDSNGETVAIGYWDGRRFHWIEDKVRIECAKGLSFITKPPLWHEPEKPGGKSS